MKILKALFLALLFSQSALADDVSPAHVYVDGEVLTAALLNASMNEIINEVNDLDGANLASNIAITTSGTLTLTGTLSATGTSNTIGNGGSDALILNIPGGLTYTSAATWTFTGNQTVSGTWANLGTVTTADINGGTLDGTVIGGSSAAAGTFTTLIATTLGAALNANSQAITNIDIDSGAIDGTPIGASSASTGAFSTLKVGTTNQGDILYDNGTSLVRLTPGTSGKVLQTQGAGANPIWSSMSSTPVIVKWGEIDTVSVTNISTTSGTSLVNGAVTVGTGNLYRYWAFSNTTYANLYQQETVAFTKSSLVSTVSGTYFLWEQSDGAGGGGGRSVSCYVDIGGQVSTTSTSQSVTPASKSWSVDVSSLSNGTSYQIKLMCRDNVGGGNATVGYVAKMIGYTS